MKQNITITMKNPLVMMFYPAITILSGCRAKSNIARKSPTINKTMDPDVMRN